MAAPFCTSGRICQHVSDIESGCSDTDSLYDSGVSDVQGVLSSCWTSRSAGQPDVWRPSKSDLVFEIFTSADNVIGSCNASRATKSHPASFVNDNKHSNVVAGGRVYFLCDAAKQIIRTGVESTNSMNGAGTATELSVVRNESLA